MKGRVMAYARLSDDASIESPYEKAEPSESLLQNSARYFSYKNLFGASLVLWIATLATLAWVLGQKPSTYGNHATNSLPFPPGMHQRCRKKSLHALLIKGSSAVPHDHFRSKPKISLYIITFQLSTGKSASLKLQSNFSCASGSSVGS